MNNWNITGNLGKDCEMASTQNGTAVCKFSVAVKSGYGDNAKTNWVNCRLYGKRAEGQLPSYLLKGQQVAINGELELAEWESNGVENKALMLKVEGLDLIGSKQDGAPQQHQPQPQQYQQQPQQYAQPQQAAQQQRPQPNQHPQQAPGMDNFDDNIPF